MISPNKSNIIRSEPHHCISFTNEHLVVKEAKQDLINEVKNPTNICKSVQSLFNTMEVKLVKEKGLSREHLAHELNAFKKYKRNLHYNRKKLVPRESNGLMALENLDKNLDKCGNLW